MFTNTYLPHVGGVARLVRVTRDVLRSRGHRVTIVAPMYDTPSDDEDDVLRVPAINARDGFALPIALPQLAAVVAPTVLGATVVHVHHPTLLAQVGRTLARALRKPIVYTYHTMYEHYAHLLRPLNTDATGMVLVSQAAMFCDTCTVVIAPSTDVAAMLKSRGVKSAVVVAASGIDVGKFARGDRAAARQRYGIPLDRFPVVGCCCRLSKEKNLPVLADAARAYPELTFLIVGDGPERDTIEGMPNVVLTGSLSGQELVDAYHAMDVFASPSISEVLPLTLMEALAAGVPLIGIRSSGANDIIKDGVNGILTYGADEFIRRIPEVARYRSGAFSSVMPYTLDRYGERLEKVYRIAKAINGGPRPRAF